MISIPLTRQGQVRCDLSLPLPLEDSFVVHDPSTSVKSCAHVLHVMYWCQVPNSGLNVNNGHMNSAALLIFCLRASSWTEAKPSAVVFVQVTLSRSRQFSCHVRSTTSTQYGQLELEFSLLKAGSWCCPGFD